MVRGARLFSTKGCLYCHLIDGHGGHRGPELSAVGRRLTPGELRIRIVNGDGNMPAYGDVISEQDLASIITFF